MDSPNHNLRVDDVRRRFDRAAATFDSADFVHKVTREGLLARIEPMAVEARTVVDLGAATGSATPALRKRFRRSHIVAVDLSAAMLEQTRSKKSWFTRMSALQADAAAISLADNSVDVVFANLLLPWLNDPPGAFVEINRVLREEGYRVILVNSNPATIMTDPDFADATYVEPLDAEVGLDGLYRLTDTGTAGSMPEDNRLAARGRGLAAGAGYDMAYGAWDSWHTRKGRFQESSR